MSEQTNSLQKFRALFVNLLLPHPLEILLYFVISLLILVIMSNQTLLEILSGGSPVPRAGFETVFSDQIDYIRQVLDVPFIGRIVLFLFWLAIGSVVYMAVWLFQNIVIEVYDDVTQTKLREKGHADSGWWGTDLSHGLFVIASIVVFIFFALFAINLLFPAWLKLFNLGLQTLSEAGSVQKLATALIGSMFTVYIFQLFWKLFFRLKNYIYNSY